VKLGNVALDGTKIQANASREQSFSHARLSEHEKQLQAIVERLLEQTEQTDREEDERYGKGRRGDELPPELADPASRLKKIREAKRALKQEAAEPLEQTQQDYSNPRRRGRPHKEEANSELSAAERQNNFTDPDSRVMHDNGLVCFLQAYNARAPAGGTVANALQPAARDCRASVRTDQRDVRVAAVCPPRSAEGEGGMASDLPYGQSAEAVSLRLDATNLLTRKYATNGPATGGATSSTSRKKMDVPPQRSAQSLDGRGPDFTPTGAQAERFFATHGKNQRREHRSETGGTKSGCWS